MFTLFKNLHVYPDEVIKIIKTLISDNKKLLITYLNQHCFNIYYSDKKYSELLDNHFLVYADGIGINYASRYLINRKYKNFNATELNEKILDLIISLNKKFMIIGGNFNKADLERKFNNVPNLIGYFNGYSDVSDFDRLSKDIKTLSPEVIIIGMGVPRQEIFAFNLSQIVHTSLFLCVGNFFEFYMGTVRRIPVKYRNKGIEWLYRIKQEPKRLWKRYFIGIPLFIFRIIRFKLISKKSG